MIQTNNNTGKQFGVFNCLAILVLLLSAPFVSTFFPARQALYAVNICITVFFLVFKNTLLDKIGWIYLLCMLLGYIFHRNMLTPFESPMYELFSWSCVICIGYSINKKKLETGNFLTMFILCFYILQCFICIYEKTSHVFVFNYISEFQATAGDAIDYSNSEFRARGLFSHPLYSANIISIIMAFILCSKQLVKKQIIGLICLGIVALWSCNSRASISIWLIIISYRFFFYGKNIIFISITLLIAYIFVPIIIDYLMNFDIVGRFNSDYDNEFSTISRLIAFDVFLSENWTWDKIIYGGDIIYYSGTDVGLENGILLTLSYWGWIIGAIKITIELIISFRFIKNIEVGERLIILLAVWGVAFLNNNSFQPFVLFYFFISCAAFNNKKTSNV